MAPIRTVAFALVASVASFGAAPASAVVQVLPQDAPVRMEWTADGPVLMTRTGMTLYIQSQENVRNEKFRWVCTNIVIRTARGGQADAEPRPVMGAQFQKSCTQKMPPYLADANAKAVGDFTIVDRPDGAKQWAFRGYPLYTSIKDRRPGEGNAVLVNTFGGGAVGRNGAWRIATMAIDLPLNLKFLRREEGLVLATKGNERPVYTPKRARLRMASLVGGVEEFQPLAAPAIASVDGDWSIIDAGAGLKQFAWKGKPLYAAPLGMADFEIAETGDWDLVVLQKAAPPPADIGKEMSLVGEVYTDKGGRTLYLYGCNGGGGVGGGGGATCDDAGDAATFMVALCGDSKECARRWHPYIAPANARPSGEWSTIDITYPMFTDPRGTLYPADAPKVRAWAYRGRPVFTYTDDKKPGDIWGHGTKGLWGSNFNAVQVPGHGAIFDQ